MYIVYNTRTHLDVAKFFDLADAWRYAQERKEDTGFTYSVYRLERLPETFDSSY